MISIIMGTYNGERFLSEQIASIVAQTRRDWKLFIFDDGSKDETCRIARDYERLYPEKIFFFQNKRNYGAKGNFFQGLGRVAKELEMDSDYFAFSDQDDVWYPNKLSLMLSKIEEVEGKDKRPAVVFSDVEITDKDLNVVGASYYAEAKVKVDRLDFASLLMENKAIGGTMMVNLSLVLKQMAAETVRGGFPEKAKMHDWWFMLLGASLGKIGYVKEVTEAYRQHENNVVGGTSFFSYVKMRLFSLSEIPKRLEENFEQAEDFLNFFGEELAKEEREVLKAFLSLREEGFFRKRKILMEHGFYKSGLIRNLALFVWI